MSTPSALLEEEAPPQRAQAPTTDAGPEKAAPAVATALGLALLGLGCLLAWWGGAWGLGGAALITLAVGLLANAHAGKYGGRVPARPAAAGTNSAASTASKSHNASSNRVGAEVMVENVVPVWSRQMEVTREAAAEGLSQLLNAFAEMSGALQTLTDNLGSYTLSAEAGAVDQAVRRESPALQALTAASTRAFAERDAAVACMASCNEGLHRLGDLGKRARELARHTRLVAFNASIEANRNRSNQTDGGPQAVAAEARMLSTHMAETSDQIDREVQALLQKMGGTLREGEILDTSPEELRLEIDLQARKALAALLGSLGSALQSSTEVHQAGQTLKDQLDAAFVHFQFGDRVSQMLAIVGNDMNNFAQWVAANPRATQTDAAEWLAALENSYTMEEQRSSHHGNVHVQKGSGVEFF